ncbi:MAG: carbohydrate ABC transporter permease [Oscillospiraceae bacterium]|nr:carbohydrate ABC transporter permease [Oscillospiraceae bacterium]
MAIFKKIKLILKNTLITIIAIVFIFPLIATVADSFMSIDEVNNDYRLVLNKTDDIGNSLFQSDSGSNKEERVSIQIIPDKISIEQYYQTLIENFDYIKMFWNSVKISVLISLLTFIIAFPQSYVFAKVKFKGSSLVFFIYIIVMMMPFQVTLLPNYLLLRFMNLLNTHSALILPAAFSPFGVFLLTQFMRYVPNETIESFKLESNSLFRLFSHIIIPAVKPGIIALFVLVFAESWNMVEQPLIFLTDEFLYPLSLALNGTRLSNSLGAPFAGAVLYVIPIITLYFYFEEEIIAGFSNWKF